MAELTDRQRAFLLVLANPGLEGRHGMHSGLVHRRALPDAPFRQRNDAGATRTLDSLERLGLVRGFYEWEATGRTWEITDAGREAAYA